MVKRVYYKRINICIFQVETKKMTKMRKKIKPQLKQKKKNWIKCLIKYDFIISPVEMRGKTSL